MMNYHYRDIFPINPACIDRNMESQKNSYSSIMVRDSEVDLEQIERTHLALSNNQIKRYNQVKNCFQNHVHSNVIENSSNRSEA